MKAASSTFLFGLVVAVYFPSLRHDFIIYDDPGYFSENARVLNGLSWSGLWWAFQATDLCSWYPLTWLSFMLDATIFGKGPLGPHLVNVLFHAANTVLLFRFLRGVTGAHWRSGLVSALFALHPLHVESVAWIAERKDVLSTFFGLLCLEAYVRYATQSKANEATGSSREPALARFASRITHHPTFYYGLAVFLFACGLLSKPMLVTLPCAMLLLDYWPLGRLSLPAIHRSVIPPLRLAFEKLPFFVLGLIATAVTVWVHKQSGALEGLASAPITGRIENAFVAYARYLGKTVWPVRLALPYPHPGQWPLASLALAVILVAGLSFAALWLGKRRPYVLVGWFWFLGMLSPVIGLVQWGTQSMADRFTYVPLIGLFIIVAWAAAELLKRARVPTWAQSTIVALVLGACVARTENQLHHWRNSEALFGHALRVTTANYTAHDELGEALAVQGRIAEARAEFSAALALRPRYAPSLANMSKLLFDEGNFEAAAALLKRLLESHPNDALTHSDLAIALVRQGKAVESVPHHLAAIRLNPNRPEPLNNLAWLLATHPNSQIRDGLQAVSLAERACNLTVHTNLSLLSTLAAAHAEAGRFADAVRIQQHLCDLVLSQGLITQTDSLQGRLELYRSGRAYHTP